MNTIQRLKNAAHINLNIPARASVFFTMSNLISKAAAFLLTPLFTRLLSPSEYGEYSLFGSYLGILIVIVSLELTGGVIMRAFQRNKELKHLTMLSALLLCLPLSLPATVTLFLLKDITGGGLGFSYAYPLLAVSLASLTVINIYVSKCKFLYKWIPYLVVSLIQSVAAPLISIIFLGLNPFKSASHVTVKIATVTTVLLTVALILLTVTFKKAYREIKEASMSYEDTKRYTRETLKFMLKLSLPLLPYYFSVMLISQADKIIVSGIFGKGVLGAYSVAHSAGIALTAVTGGLMSSLSPWLMRRARSGDFDKIREILDTVTSITAVVIVIFLSLAPDVFKFLAPKEYYFALPIIFISALIPIPLSLAQCASSISIAKEKVGGVLLSGILPMITVFALNLILSEMRKIYIPALISLFGYLLLMTLGIVHVRLKTGKYIINVNNTLQKSLFLLFASAVLFLAKDMLFIRITVSFIFSLLLLYMLKGALVLLREREKTTG